MILEESVLTKREEEGSTLAWFIPDDGNVLIPSTVMTCLLYTSHAARAAHAAVPDRHPAGHHHIGPQPYVVADGHRPCVAPVSYTHLDVYKRQPKTHLFLHNDFHH